MIGSINKITNSFNNKIVSEYHNNKEIIKERTEAPARSHSFYLISHLIENDYSLLIVLIVARIVTRTNTIS